MSGEFWIPFSNGSEYDNWRFHNCERCKKDYDPVNARDLCDLEKAIAVASGLTPAQQARIGIVEKPYKHLGACKEIEPIAAPSLRSGRSESDG